MASAQGSAATSRTTSRAVTPTPVIDSTNLPRILCLHGGGTNADIFRMQCRQIIRYLPDFRLVFVDAPWFCAAGPGVYPVYESCGPFRRWLRWLPEHKPIDDASAIEEIMYAIDACKREDEGTGPWVGLLGFSQGAKMVSSLLYDQQVQLLADTDYKFAVVMNGRGPLVSFRDASISPSTVRPGTLSDDCIFEGESDHVLSLPTIHVHGLLDPGLELHQNLLEKFHDPQTTTLIEWDGGHRIPIKKEIVEKICDEVYRIARREGVDF